MKCSYWRSTLIYIKDAVQDLLRFPAIHSWSSLQVSLFQRELPFVTLPHVTYPPGGEGTCPALVTTPSSQHLPALCKEDFVSDYSLNAPGRPVLRLLHWVLSTSTLSLHHALGAWSFCKAALNALRTPVSTLCKREKDTVYWALGLVPLRFSSWMQGKEHTLHWKHTKVLGYSG